MKKVLVVLFKITLPLLFLYNIGFFFLNFSALLKDTSQNVPFNQKNHVELVEYINEKIRTAEEKDKTYGPYDYFRDLNEIKKFEKSHPGTMSHYTMIEPLMSLHSRNFQHQYFTGEDISKARDYFDELENPGITLRNKIESEHLRKTWWPNLSAWLLKVYLKNIFLALALFLFWWYEEKKHLKILNPLSFLVSLIFYPITIAIIIKEALTEEGRYYFAEAELRRTKDKMFAMLSENEIAALRRFAKSRGLKMADWRNSLESQGLTPRRLLIPAITVTILFIFIPRVSFSQKLTPSTSAKIFVEQILTVNIDAPPKVDQQNNDDHKIQYYCNDQIINYFFYEFDLRNLSSIFIRAWVKKISPQEVIRKIDHVPCFHF